MNTRTRKLVYTALFAALTAVGAFLRIPMVYSSVTLQYLFTAMAGLLLGRRWGALSQAVYVLLGLVGLPIFTMGGGFGYVFQPTFGFLLGLIPAAWVVGAVAGESLDPKRMALASLAGLAALYAVQPKGLPFDLGQLPTRMIWHERFQRDARHIWLRKHVEAAYRNAIR